MAGIASTSPLFRAMAWGNTERVEQLARMVAIQGPHRLFRRAELVNDFETPAWIN
jgi:hypothetical protein